MKWIKTLLAAFVAVALTTTPSLAGTAVKIDNRGHKYLVDVETGHTLGAGSGMGAVIGTADTTRLYVAHPWDVSLLFSGEQTDQSGTTSPRLAYGMGGTLYLSDTFGLGGNVYRPDSTNPKVWRITPEGKLYVAWNPQAAQCQGFRFSLFSYTFSTGNDNTFGPDGTAWKGGALSLDPSFKGFVEVPVLGGSVEANFGLTRLITDLGTNVEDTTDWNAAVRYNIWAVR